MNKQEAIERINDLWNYALEDGPFEVDLINKSQVIDIITKIDEPQKVVVPKFVADWYEDIKGNFYLNLHYRAWDMFESLDENSCVPEKPLADDFTRWYYNTKNAIQTLVNMHQFGYEVEKEKLYTVEIPDPNSYCDYRYLSRNDNGICLDASNDTKWKQKKRNQFTESEIKEDFEWAWQFAKPVEEG